jgi:KipI family sensor histidine kinase inhibitor
MGKLRIQRLSEQAMVVAWEPLISREVHDQVLQLDERVNAASFPGWIENVPAYHTLTVYFDPLAAPADPAQHLEGLLLQQPLRNQSPGRLLRVPVLYDPEVAPDLLPAAQRLGLSVEELVDLHTSQRYHVYLLGFMPGFPYMGILPERLRLPRKHVPSPKLAAGTVAMADRQTGIYPFDSPGGWHAIGKTSIPLFEKGKAYFEPGDDVEFYAVNRL